MVFKKECPQNRSGKWVASFCEHWINGNCTIIPKELCYFLKEAED